MADLNFKKPSAKELNIVVAVLGLVIFLAAYYVGYQNLSEKNEKLDKKISEQNAYLIELKEYYENLSVYEDGINTSKANIKKNLNRLPRGIVTEDFLVYMMELADAVHADFTNVSFTDSTEIDEFECVIDNETKTVTGYICGSSTSSSMSYDNLKKYIKYIYDENDYITFIDSISISYNAEYANLDTSVSLSKYYITYDGSVYVPVPVPNISIGTGNLFGTLELPTQQ